MFAQDSVLWNVNTRLCVKPEEPTFTGDKTPAAPRERRRGSEGGRLCGYSSRATWSLTKLPSDHWTHRLTQDTLPSSPGVQPSETDKRELKSHFLSPIPSLFELYFIRSRYFWLPLSKGRHLPRQRLSAHHLNAAADNEWFILRSVLSEREGSTCV